MFFEILIFLLIGIFFGIITGLTPGIHINLVAVILLSLSPFLLLHFSVFSVVCLIIAMSITHTFLDFIPSTFLGAPEEATALAVLPAHKLLLRGMGYEAVRLSVIGSLLCLIFVVVSSFVLLKIIPQIFELIKPYIGWILLFVVSYMIFKSKNKNRVFWSSFIFILSGIFGVTVFSLHMKDPLFPMFSGMFGISMLVTSIFEKVVLPKQRVTEMIKIKTKNIAKAVSAGSFSGALTTLFPGLGPAQAAIIATQIVGKIGIYSYIILIGGIGTASMVMSLVTLFTIEKARNGAIIVVQELLKNIGQNEFVLFAAITLVAGGIATFLCLYVAKVFADVINKINYQLLCIAIISLISVLAFFMTGWIGFLILVVSTFLGFLPPMLNVGRNNLMGCLLLPVILYFLL
ncbi:tripartite tricarboxylate transporter permease [Candidatus Woesearchaeota archaeon]|nr:tripartite tricarboxylate transporter permease [Candidatus Woesearchaeota archaeon]